MSTTREALSRLLKDMESSITKAKALLEGPGRNGQQQKRQNEPPQTTEDIRAIADRPTPPDRSGPRKTPG